MAAEVSKYFLVLVLGVALGVLIGLNFLPDQVVEKTVEIQVLAQDTSRAAEMFFPAVTTDGDGAMFPLGVEAKLGTGKTLVDLDNLVFVEDTQSSVKKAREAAGRASGADLSKLDLTYYSNTNQLTIIGGESAGAGMTILTIAAIKNKTIPRGVTITGAISSNGSITKVGGVGAKAKVVASNGYTVFLVPPNQSNDPVKEKFCVGEGADKVCEEKETGKVKDAVENVIEVSSIYEALLYFGL
ncbi:MAG: hypothetical protein J4451_02160 [DPANN group archaeon]|nr:hypothetical protein [DPANN group archaeon]